MSTHAAIITKTSHGNWRVAYLHFDGYPEHAGRMLRKHYASQELAEKLAMLGDLSVLAESCEKPEGHNYATPMEGYSIAYHRDRGEKFMLRQAPTLKQALKLLGEQYQYVWDGQTWDIAGMNAEEEFAA